MQHTFIDLAGNRYDTRDLFNRWSVTKTLTRVYSSLEGETKDGRFISCQVAYYAARAGEFELQEVGDETAKAANLLPELQFMDDTAVKWMGRA